VGASGSMRSPRYSNGRLAFALCVASLLWGAYLVVGAFTWRAYGGSSGPATLVEVNGTYAAYLMAVPGVFAAVVFVALRMTCSRGSELARRTAITLISLLACLTLLGMATIGLFAIPTLVALGLSAAVTPRPEP
jgi:hypothetical protein